MLKYLLLLLICSCTYQTDITEEEMSYQLVAAQTTEMSRTAFAGTALKGLPVGNPLPNLQVNHLEPGEHTVQFQVIPPADGLGFAAYAIVDWKVQGQQVQRKISVASGAVISGVCEAVHVTIVDVSNGLAAAPYKVAATLTKGSRPSLNQPGVLVTQPRAIVIPPNSSQDFLVPQDAGVISVYVFSALPVAPGVSSDLLVQLQDAGGNTLGNFSPAGQGSWVPLISGCTSVHVVTDGAITASVNVLWGVDG